MHDHPHGLDLAHGHLVHGDEMRAGNLRRMGGALAVNVAMVAAAAVGAAITGSLALLADAGHVFSDVLAIVIAIVAARLAKRPVRGRGTFGLGRVEIFAALVNGIVLMVIAAAIAAAAIGRLAEPHDVQGGGVLLFGAFGLTGNLIATWILLRGDRADINLEAVLRHSVADALGSLGVIVAGAGILLTGWQPLDPVIGLVIAALILASSWRLVREPVEVLLERAPSGVEVEEVGTAIAGVPGVREVHDLHVWSITSGFPALAAHVTVKATHETGAVRAEIESMLESRFGLAHTTLQVSCEQLLQLEPKPED